MAMPLIELTINAIVFVAVDTQAMVLRGSTPSGFVRPGLFRKYWHCRLRTFYFRFGINFIWQIPSLQTHSDSSRIELAQILSLDNRDVSI